jgi:hypothetical protein
MTEHSPPAPGWDVRPYQPGDEAQLVALYARVFGRPRALDTWRWKLRGRNPPFETVWVATTPAGEIVGQYGGIPLRLKLGEAVLPAVHAVEAMTDPAYRRQGMLTRLGSAAHQMWAAAGQVAVIGLPNEQWGTRNWALGYRPVFPLGWLRFPLHLERVARRPGKLPRALAGPAAALGAAGSHAYRRLAGRALRRQAAGAGVTVEDVTDPGAEFDRLWADLGTAYPNFVVRDAAWVTWRFAHSGGYRYRVLLARQAGAPAGYIAYRLDRSEERVAGYIGDLFVGPDAAAPAAALVDAALADLSAQGAATVLATGAPGSALYGLLRGLGFLPLRPTFTFEIVPLASGMDPAALADPRAWHLTAGDFDVI